MLFTPCALNNLVSTCLYGVRQLCSGLKAGIEGSVHAMRELYEEHCGNGWELLLVDAKKNALNRAAALWNVWVVAQMCDSCLTPSVDMPH